MHPGLLTFPRHLFHPRSCSPFREVFCKGHKSSSKKAASPAIAGTGGQLGPDLSAVGSRLTREQLEWRILSGRRNMPAYGTTIQPTNLNALVDFLQSRKSP